MAPTTTRVLRLLSLLQDRSHTGRELAERLGVTERTLRQDIQRLRELGYPVHAARGAVGGYRLGQGAKMPPLLLDDDEAVAVTLAVAQAEDGSTAITDIDIRLRGRRPRQQAEPQPQAKTYFGAGATFGSGGP